MNVYKFYTLIHSLSEFELEDMLYVYVPNLYSTPKLTTLFQTTENILDYIFRDMKVDLE